ncbi:Zinc finger CCCH domain-containing protein 15 [Thelohanellus kitauei]|uniref:Zinc finger CCCH domain-containing protein 15 n=1 Tax=Thelohanellus kitauei TaxID=669202 RepID=A0A0C2N3P1_THEKT|nr:Zinc finger CCCH domain-containing protein 15 [Thelohanellus kitauei]
MEIEAMKEIGSLLKPVVEKQQLESGVDPKSVLCQYFKLGACTKGNKCKFSHDLNQERKTEKINIYTDQRDNAEELDLEGLENMIEKKHGKTNKNVCKHFLEAVEKRLYGWFWICPNGGDKCQYRHALPAGYVLRRDKPQGTQLEEVSIEELIEKQRSELEGDLIPVNEETFKIWKAQKINQKKEKLESEMNKKREEMLSGNILSKVGVLFTPKITGRDCFVLDPTLINQDDEEADYEILREENNEPVLKSDEVITEKMAKLKIQEDVITKSFSLNPKQRMMG